MRSLTITDTTPSTSSVAQAPGQTPHPPARSLAVTESPVPEPGTGEITIDVEAAGIGLIDAFWATGVMPQHEGFIPGIEVAGTVRAIGGGDTSLVVGQRVAALLPGAGGFAEVVRARMDLVAPIPGGMSSAQAAVVPINTVTAHLALTTVARCEAGETVLVHAGIGGLGSQFGQIARVLGASRVDAVVGTPDKQQAALELGYDNAYLRNDLSAIHAGTYDIVIDPVGGEATRDAFRVLRGGGRMLRVGNASQAADVSVSTMAHWLENKTTVGFNVGAWLGTHPEQGADSLRWALTAVADGSVRVDLTATTQLGDQDSLISDLLAGRTTGKVAIVMRSSTALRAHVQ